MKVYLSGPMTGYPELNYPAFKIAARRMRVEGFEVYSPHEWEDRYNAGVFNLQIAFADYCYFIAREADAVVVLEGWENSPGASAEVALACALSKPVYAYDSDTGLLGLLDIHPPVWAAQKVLDG